MHIFNSLLPILENQKALCDLSHCISDVCLLLRASVMLDGVVRISLSILKMLDI